MKIYIDPGHGGYDSGAEANGLKEKDLTLEIGLEVQDILLNEYSGAMVRMSRNSDVFRTLDWRTDDANRWGANFFCSIHINAGKGMGFESYIYNGSIDSDTFSAQDNIHSEIIKRSGGMHDRGQKRANFHVLRKSLMSAVLTENGFIDTSTDAEKMKSNTWIENIARGHAVGITKHFNLKKREGMTSTNLSPIRKGTSGRVYRVQIGAFGSKSNADHQVNLAKDRGFKDAYILKEGSLYKVQIGTFNVYENAEEMVEFAKDHGFSDAFIS